MSSPTAARAGSASAGWRPAWSLYVTYRVTQGKPLLKRVVVPERALRGERRDAEYGSILVPILGRPLDDDIVQTAGRLAAEEDAESFEEDHGATIEALWVFEVPMSLPIDAALPDEQLKRARAALRAGQGGGGGVRGRRGRDRDGPRAPRRARRSSTRPGAAACRRSCWPPRSRRRSAAARCSAAAAARSTTSSGRSRST